MTLTHSPLGHLRVQALLEKEAEVAERAQALERRKADIASQSTQVSKTVQSCVEPQAAHVSEIDSI
jgi:hypothetical protein